MSVEISIRETGCSSRKKTEWQNQFIPHLAYQVHTSEVVDQLFYRVQPHDLSKMTPPCCIREFMAAKMAACILSKDDLSSRCMTCLLGAECMKKRGGGDGGRGVVHVIA
jgi:hypothetical protein